MNESVAGIKLLFLISSFYDFHSENHHVLIIFFYHCTEDNKSILSEMYSGN
jgi:hypothetical protein